MDDFCLQTGQLVVMKNSLSAVPADYSSWQAWDLLVLKNPTNFLSSWVFFRTLWKWWKTCTYVQLFERIILESAVVDKWLQDVFPTGVNHNSPRSCTVLLGHLPVGKWTDAFLFWKEYTTCLIHTTTFFCALSTQHLQTFILRSMGISPKDIRHADCSRQGSNHQPIDW